MPIIVPTVTENDHTLFHSRVLQLASFAKRLHLDYADGELAPTELAPLEGSAWPADIEVDMHIMYMFPTRHTDEIIDLKPNRVIFHAEAKGDLMRFAKELASHGIEVGLAILPDSKVSDCAKLIEVVSTVLIFGGKIGYQGGVLDEAQLVKIGEIKKINDDVEIAWDGGINDSNARMLVEAGVKVLNVGGAISGAADPHAAYLKIEACL